MTNLIFCMHILQGCWFKILKLLIEIQLSMKLFEIFSKEFLS